MSQDEKDNPFPKEPVRGPYHSWPRLDFIPVPGPDTVNVDPVPFQYSDKPPRDYKLENSEQYGLVVREDEVEAYAKLGFIPVPGKKRQSFEVWVDQSYYPPFTPTTDTLEELGRIIKDRAGYLLAEEEFQKFIADR